MALATVFFYMETTENTPHILKLEETDAFPHLVRTFYVVLSKNYLEYFHEFWTSGSVRMMRNNYQRNINYLLGIETQL